MIKKQCSDGKLFNFKVNTTIEKGTPTQDNYFQG